MGAFAASVGVRGDRGQRASKAPLALGRRVDEETPCPFWSGDGDRFRRARSRCTGTTELAPAPAGSVSCALWPRARGTVSGPPTSRRTRTRLHALGERQLGRCTTHHVCSSGVGWKSREYRRPSRHTSRGLVRQSVGAAEETRPRRPGRGLASSVARATDRDAEPHARADSPAAHRQRLRRAPSPSGIPGGGTGVDDRRLVSGATSPAVRFRSTDSFADAFSARGSGSEASFSSASRGAAGRATAGSTASGDTSSGAMRGSSTSTRRGPDAQSLTVSLAVGRRSRPRGAQR